MDFKVVFIAEQKKTACCSPKPESKFTAFTEGRSRWLDTCLAMIYSQNKWKLNMKGKLPTAFSSKPGNT